MTSKRSDQNYGPPPPVTKLTMEQDLKMRLLEDRLNSDDVDKKDIVTVFLALQKQNFVLANSMINLVKSWPLHPTTTTEGLPLFGILLETKDSRLQDLEKAIHYLENELEYEENLSIRTGEGIPFEIRDQEQSSETSEILSKRFDC